MKTFAIHTLGCKVNQYDSQQIRELLERSGFRMVNIDNSPELVIVGTCCVTHIASSKSRQMIRKAQKHNPDSLIIAAGCLPKLKIGELNNLDKNIRILSDQKDTAAELKKIITRDYPKFDAETLQNAEDKAIKADTAVKIKDKNRLSDSAQLPALTSFSGQTRAFLKVQDGCDCRCTYCIIPKIRNDISSKPADRAVSEAQALVNAGHKEIVLTGIFLGAYGQNSCRRRNWETKENPHLAELLAKLAQIKGLARIRLSSLEPSDVIEPLLDVFCENPNIMPHLHLSLQSGSDRILKKMCRSYSRDEFLEKVAMIRERLDRPAITTDIIVGFPGESDSDFEDTLDFAKQVGFAKMHVFTYSKRQVTAAAKMQDAIDNKVKNQRSKILRELDKQLGKDFRDQFIGESAEILIEKVGSRTAGRCERYFMVNIEPKAKIAKNDIVKVKFTSNSAHETTAKII